MTPALRAVLFDFDFTLVDCSEAIFECVRHACACCGYAAPAPDLLRPLIGLSLPAVHSHLSGAPAHEPRFVAAFLQRADQIMEPRTVVLPGAIDAVRGLRAAGLQTGIVSTKVRRRLEEILLARAIRDLFDIVLGLEDVPAPKPDPSGLLAAAAAMGLAPGEALYIGDHEVDARAAARAGMRFLGVLTGATTREQFAALGSSCVSSLRDLPRALGVSEATCPR